ncbi:MAG TPA: DUF1330 domain-containing protein [Pseudolabrys sp.]|nr:DUF1330 domain-containing protein [Pseudolabrys sp.]
MLVEFDSLDKALACHDTPAYRDALEGLGSGIERDMRVVERRGVTTLRTDKALRGSSLLLRVDQHFDEHP